MDIGLDSFSLHPLKLDAFGELEWTKAHAFAGIQFGDIGLLSGGDPGRLREIRAHADLLGLRTQVSVGGCNPFFAELSERSLAGRNFMGFWAVRVSDMNCRHRGQRNSKRRREH